MMGPIKIVQVCLVFWNLFSGTEPKITDAAYRLMPKMFHLDNFDECMELGDLALYCTINVQLAPTDSQNQSDTWKVIQKTVDNPRYYRHDKIRHGICISESCPNIVAHLGSRNGPKTSKTIDNPPDDHSHEFCTLDSCPKKVVANPTITDELKNGVVECYTSKYEHLGLKAVQVVMHCQTDNQTYPIDNVDVTVAIALAILVWIVAFATFYEGRARYKPKEEYEKIVNTRVGSIIACFSLPRNWDRLRRDTTDPDHEQLKCLQGMRFYNVLLVIMVHAALCTTAGSVDNPPFIESLSRTPENVVLINSLAVIQTFMIISGFLVTYNLYLTIERGKKFSLRYILSLFVSRYLRLTPCLIVMMALTSTWFYHVGNGPNWDKGLGSEYRNCRENWWANLLYINNYYDVEHMCMQHAWYLATDTQLFAASLVVLTLMWRYPERTKLILGLSIGIGFALPSVINYYYNYDIVIRMYPEALYTIFLDLPHWHVMYSSSAVNFGAYALGIACGYAFCKRRHAKIFTNKFYVALWWILGFSLPFSVILYGYFIYQEDYQYTRLGAAFYVAIYRGFYAIGVSILMYGSAEGVGWVARDTLKWEPVQVLGRLTYCIYLVHVVLMRMRAGQSRHPMYLSHYTLLVQVAGDATLSVIFAVLLALFVELPVSALQNLIAPGKQKKISVNSSPDDAKNFNKEIGAPSTSSHHF